MSRKPHLIAGLVAGLAGIAVSHAVTMLLTIRATPLLAVAEVIIEYTPGDLAEALIQVVGRYDKPLLIVGVTLGVLGLSALAGVLAARSQLLAQLVFVAMAVVGLAAVWSRPGFAVYDALPVVAGAVTWLVVLSFLVDHLSRMGRARADDLAAAGDADQPTHQPASQPTDQPTDPPADQPALRSHDEPEAVDRVTDDPDDVDRRRFLTWAGSIAATAVVVGVLGQLAGQARRSVETARRLLRLPVTNGVVPEGAALGLSGIEPWRTSNAEFYRIDTALVVPTVDPTEWRLRIHGMVDNEIVLSYRDLLERELTQAWVTLCCVSNDVGGDLIGNAWWSGVRVADLLREAGVSPEADAVLQTSHDDWTCGTPLSALTDDRNAMLAIAMNGEPLPIEHGFPVRMLVPGLYGYVSATKWLVDLEVTRFDRISAYWTERGWAERGPVRTQSRIDVPRDGADVRAGQVRIGGSAWAQHTGIDKVEYRLDGERWREARLARVPNVDTWVQWTATVDVPEGDHRLAVRATDRSGYTQTPVRRGPVPDGATGWHTIEFHAG